MTQRQLENELSRLLLDGALEPGDRVRIDQRDGSLTFKVDKHAAQPPEQTSERQVATAR